MNRETRQWIILTTVSNRLKYYAGYNVSYNDDVMHIVGAAICMQECHHHKKVASYIYQKQENGKYHLASTYNASHCHPMNKEITAEDMQALQDSCRNY